MIHGTGIDIVELDRIEKLHSRQEAFSKRILTPKEQAHFSTLSAHRQIEFLAGRFAAKEAFSKALEQVLVAIFLFKQSKFCPMNRINLS